MVCQCFVGSGKLDFIDINTEIFTKCNMDRTCFGEYYSERSRYVFSIWHGMVGHLRDFAKLKKKMLIYYE